MCILLFKPSFYKGSFLSDLKRYDRSSAYWPSISSLKEGTGALGCNWGMWFEWDGGEDGTWLGEHGTHGDSPPRDEAEADPKRTLELQRTRGAEWLADSTFWQRNKLTYQYLYLFCDHWEVKLSGNSFLSPAPLKLRQSFQIKSYHQFKEATASQIFLCPLMVKYVFSEQVFDLLGNHFGIKLWKQLLVVVVVFFFPFSSQLSKQIFILIFLKYSIGLHSFVLSSFLVKMRGKLEGRVINIQNVTSDYQKYQTHPLQFTLCPDCKVSRKLSGARGPRSNVNVASCPLPRPILFPAAYPTE